jgi:hypothetical protein
VPEPDGGRRALAYQPDCGEYHRGQPGGMDRNSPRAVPPENRDGQQGERRLAAEHHHGPGHAHADLTERIHRAGVLVHPLSWHRQRPGPPGLVLGYAAHPPDQLREAARRIARVLGT